jgi:ribonucleoside-diphosphate reductase alpha chain
VERILIEQISGVSDVPSGWTGNEQVGYAKSIMDYIFRWLELRFLSGTRLPLFATAAAPSANASGTPNQTPHAAFPRFSRMCTRPAMHRSARPAAH